MAEVIQREWTIPGQKTKRKAWGFTITLNGKRIRRSDASWDKDAAEKALAAVKLQELLGRASLTMTMRYAHLSPDRLRTAVSRLAGLTSGTSRAHEPAQDLRATSKSA